MMKKVFIVHGWGESPNEGWFPWLKKELESKGFKVEVPAMPNADEPQIGPWVSFLRKKVKNPDVSTFFVGHSIGCQTILRYLEMLPKGIKMGGVIFVAGWFNLTNLESEEEKKIAKTWLETPIDLKKVKQHVKKFVAVFSDNDPYVPLSDAKVFEKKLNAKLTFKHNMGHFSGDDNVKELPDVLNQLLGMAKL